MEKLGIPAETNEGLFDVKITVELARMMLYGTDMANSINRALRRPKIRPLVLHMKNGTWNEENHDTIIIFNWHSKFMNGQKRLVAYIWACEHGIVHPKYKDGIWMRIAYGDDPAIQPLIDAAEERIARDRQQLSDDPVLNKHLHEMTRVAFKIRYTISTAAIADQDREAILRSNEEGFKWASQLGTTESIGRTSPVRLAFAELYKQSSRKAEKFYNCFADLSTEDIPAARRFRSWTRNTRGVNYQRSYYRRAVAYMQAYLNDEDVPETKYLSETDWTCNLGYPRLHLADGLPGDDVPAQLKSMGFKNVTVCMGACRLVLNRDTMPEEEIKHMLINNRDAWYWAGIKSNQIRVTPFSASALAAFCYEHKDQERQIDNFFSDANKAYLIEIGERLKAKYLTLRSRVAQRMCYSALNDRWNGVDRGRSVHRKLVHIEKDYRVTA